MERVFVDTSAWFAFLNAADPDHEAVAEVLEVRAAHLVTTDYVFDELVTLVRYRIGHAEACRAGEFLRSRNITVLVAVQPADIERAWRQFTKHADKKYSFTDCTSFATMRRLGIQHVIAIDPDFRRAGFTVLPA